MTAPSFGPDYGGVVDLLCPVCRGEYLHRGGVTITDERIVIGFWCEECTNKPSEAMELTIEQTKGNARLSWRVHPALTVR